MSKRDGMRETFDVVISGASFTGLALALALSKALGPGVRIAVIDRVGEAPSGGRPAGPRHQNPRAFNVAAGSKALLLGIGVWQHVKAVAQPVLKIEISDSPLDAGVRPTLLTYDNLTDEAAPASFIVPDGDLWQALSDEVDAASGDITMIGGREAVRADVRGDAAIVHLKAGSEIVGRLVVAAEGRRSALREAAGIGLVSRDYKQRGIVVQVAHERPHDGVAVQHFLPGGPFAILPMRGDVSCITWSEAAGEAERILALNDEAFLDEVELRFGGRLGRLTLASPRQSWPLAMHLARSFAGQRLALIGDTARGVHPIAGQGLNLGLRDVAALAEAVTDQARLGLDIGAPAVLERYSAWRRFDSVQSTAAFDAFNRLFSNDYVLLRSLREAGLGLVDRLPLVKQALVSEAAGLQGDVPKLMRGKAL